VPKLKYPPIAPGCRYGRLTAISEMLPKMHPTRNTNQRIGIWKCLCECGTTVNVLEYGLKSGRAQSCGCIRRGLAAAIGAANVTHGESRRHEISSAEYRSWNSMKGRVLNPKNSRYESYKEMGVTISERWLRYENFLADMGRKPGPNYSIDRIDNGLGYVKENCRWATRKQQCRNTRRNRWITLNGTTLTMAEWAERSGIPSRRIEDRLDRLGWSVDEALTTPVNRNRRYLYPPRH
jgi:hypothetical protein